MLNLKLNNGGSSNLICCSDKGDLVAFIIHYLPLLDHGAHLVAGQVHAMEVGKTVLALNILCDEFELAERHLVILQVSKAHLEHSPLKTI